MPAIHPLSGLASAAPADVGLNPAALERLTAVMARQLAQGRVPGLSMLVSRHGKVAYSTTLGALTPDGPAMPADAIFRIYSMTKPVVSVALMMLIEDGRLFLTDPLSRFIPEFADTKVGIVNGDKLDLVDQKRPITIHDLLRHTSGLTYGFTGNSPVQRRYVETLFQRRGITSAEFCADLAALPLMWQPGERFEYSHSTDVIGRVVEIVSGQSLDNFLQASIFGPLGMVDTGFHVPPDQLHRLAEGFDKDPVTGKDVRLIDVRTAPAFQSGGGGLVSTIADYARFVQMLAGGGSLNGVRILAPRLIEFMASDHLEAHMGIDRTLLPPGNRFGLGFAVRTQTGIAPSPGSAGEYFWGGLAGTAFWISPHDGLFAIMMVQAPEQRDYFRLLFRTLVYAALD
ncbi:MAG: beta-lactamase family protein [Hyphomicrobiales bacterium]|nr:beta-lactamase family protein [Hyphomicrobiales bacterium]MDE2115137.1 beta-lactamase family protein [Hyphomicrobiales bacterium]